MLADVNRFELRRYRNGQKDLDFHPCYSEADWAVEVARDYTEPGALIEVWDTVENKSVPLVAC